MIQKRFATAVFALAFAALAPAGALAGAQVSDDMCWDRYRNSVADASCDRESMTVSTNGQACSLTAWCKADDSSDNQTSYQGAPDTLEDLRNCNGSLTTASSC